MTKKKCRIRFGLCCIFAAEPIRFRVATAAALSKRNRGEAFRKLSEICLHNARALRQTLHFCHQNGIGSFRVTSTILPLKTHSLAGYEIHDLPQATEIVEEFVACGLFARKHDIRTTFHPDQFILLNSPRAEVVKNSMAELLYQAEVAEWIGADVINLHAGGAYNDKPSALLRLKGAILDLPVAVRERLTLENDDKLYTPADLIPLCSEANIPLVYDVHHHRCNPDGWSIKKATAQAMKTWNREPLFHISSPSQGWEGAQPQRHHDYIDAADFPSEWHKLKVTVEVEAKMKELAISKLKEDLLNSI